MPSLIRSIEKACGLRCSFKTPKSKRNTLFTNTKREKKNGKFIFTKHVIKRDMNIPIRMFNFKIRDNMRNKRIIKRIGERRKGEKEATKATFNRFKINKGKVIF